MGEGQLSIPDGRRSRIRKRLEKVTQGSQKLNTEVRERRKKDNAEHRENRKAETKKRKFGALERKSPPFAEKREGWGTLKFF